MARSAGRRARFVLVGVVIGLVALLTTLLSGLATGLVDDGISGLRPPPAHAPGDAARGPAQL